MGECIKEHSADRLMAHRSGRSGRKECYATGAPPEATHPKSSNKILSAERILCSIPKTHHQKAAALYDVLILQQL